MTDSDLAPLAGCTTVEPAPRLSRLWWFTAPMLTVLIGALLAAGSVRLPYVVLRPGNARSVVPLVSITAKPGGPAVHEEKPTGDLLYVTVSSSVKPSGLLVMRGWLDDKAEVEPADPFLGTQTSAENRKLNLRLMSDSQEKAKKVALERLGYKVHTTPIGAFLEDVDPSYPGAKVLKPGMTVVEAGGKPVRTGDDLVAAIATKKPGDRLKLRVVPLQGGEPRAVTAKLAKRPGTADTPVLGVSLADRATYQFPVDIRIDTGQVGGPSAGLAFTLAILDRLTPGSLTGGKRVAVTGTIEVDGTVGPVGGVDHKTEAAISEGAKLFLVPPDEYATAKKAARGRIKIEKVSTLDEALAALQANGGQPLPKVGA